jgi:hypothetical protein
VQALQRDWQGVAVELANEASSTADRARDVVWRYGSGAEQIEGYAHSSGQGIYLEGPDGLVTDFVLWYRRLVPADEQIIFCDDTYSFDTLVEPDTSREEVLEALAG